MEKIREFILKFILQCHFEDFVVAQLIRLDKTYFTKFDITSTKFTQKNCPRNF